MMLTKEQIELDQWKFTGKAVDYWFEKEGNFERTSWTSYKARLHYNTDDYWMTVEIYDSPDWNCIFHGKVHNILEFHFVMKAIQLDVK